MNRREKRIDPLLKLKKAERSAKQQKVARANEPVQRRVTAADGLTKEIEKLAESVHESNVAVAEGA